MSFNEHVDRMLAVDGYAHVPGVAAMETFERFGGTLGTIVSRETIALRPGAHAYVAKHGPVPLHTDHPEADLVIWFCEKQDSKDGATMLLDARPVLGDLPRDVRSLLRQVELCCPAVEGGPPLLRFPVLERAGDLDLVFCSPWLQAASRDHRHQAALDVLRERLSAAARARAIDVRMAPGDILVVDNRRMLHGRRAIAEQSARRLHRLWISRSGKVTPMPAEARSALAGTR